MRTKPGSAVAIDDENDQQPEVSSPGVSVIIAARNAADTIERAVRSALAQPEARQIIVVNDASSDDTAARAQRLADDGRVQVLSLTVNLGPAGARNSALEIATEDFVAVLDADDYMLPGRLARLLEQADGYDLIADDLCLASEITPRALEGRLLELAPEACEPLDLRAFALGNISRPGRSRREMGFLKPLMRRSFLHSQSVAYAPGLRLGEDYILYAQALARGARMKLVGASGYVAVRRPASLSGSHTEDDLRRFYEACLALGDEANLDLRSRAAVLRHAASVRRRLTHVEVLRERRSNGARSAIGHLARRPTDIAYVLTQTARDKLAGFRSARSSARL